MENQDKKNILKSIISQFQEVGFSDKQILKLIEERQKENEKSFPFARVDIKERFRLFEEIFSSCDVSKEDMYKTLSEGKVFSYLPASISDLLSFLQKKGMDSGLFLREMASTAHGRAVLSWGPKKIKSNINEALDVFEKYQISMQDFMNMTFKYPNILKINPKNLDSRLLGFIKFSQSYGVSIDNSMWVLKKQPDILLKDMDTLKKKCDVMGNFVQQYGVEKNEWIETCFAHPKLLCKDTNALMQNISIYQENFKDGIFCFSQYPNADAKHLMRYLMTSPQYIAISPSNVNERMKYAKCLLEKGQQATTSVLYLSKEKMRQNLKDISK
ncbi:MAG: hypothetical protein IJY92_05100 [Alphaproteobacteria bacterium]|nr:hypothetical protein [Alphaproteobacteria bacterium]